MSERFQRDLPDFRAPQFLDVFQPLPGWLADRLLRPDEKVSWVRGPKLNPSWERYATHPALFVLASCIGAIAVALARLFSEEGAQLTAIAVLFAGLLVVFTVIVLGIANGYFTRLVVTTDRLVILQGYEICRSWSMDKLPPNLLRYGSLGEQERWSIDLDAVKSMLGGPTDKFTDAKSILSFGKQLDRITIRDKDRP